MDFKVEWHDRIGSTNTFLRERFCTDQKTVSGLIVAALEQTAGRGRQERKWQSAPNANLCFSLLLETDTPLVQTPSLTMAVALAVTDMLNSIGLRATPKWPNDVLIGDKKICGILSEHVEHEKHRAIIVGVGLNVNMTCDEAVAIDRPATSILIESGAACDLSNILEALIPRMNYWIERWKCGGFAAIRDQWIEQSGPIGKTLSIHDGAVLKTGTLAGFGQHGELCLKTRTGIETIWTGDVS